MKKTKSKPTRRHDKNQLHSDPPKALPFIEHLLELRKRLFYVAFSVVVFGGLAYAAQKPIIAALLQPAGDQQFIFTSPGGGFDFLFKICLYGGIVGSIPVIVYQLLRYLQPLMPKGSLRVIAWGSFASAVLAALGMAFGYFFGLPAAMQFLLNQFTTDQIKALITIQSYMNFVMLYLAGSALLFQVPLILLMINRIKPLSTKKLLGYERWFIVIAFVLGAIINPSPNIQDQLMLSVPMIVMYQLSIVLVWLVNRKLRRYEKVQKLLQQDAAARQERLERFARAQDKWRTAVAATYQTEPLPASTPVIVKPVRPAATVTSSTVPIQRPAVARPIAPSPRPMNAIPPASIQQASRPASVAPRRFVTDVSRRPYAPRFASDRA